MLTVPISSQSLIKTRLSASKYRVVDRTTGHRRKICIPHKKRFAHTKPQPIKSPL